MKRRFFWKAIVCALSLVSSSYSFAEDVWLTETLHGNWGQTFQVTKIYFEDKTGQQQLIVFENPIFGRILALDGIIQTTEKDEFVYHEMITHVPILSHGKVQNVLVIGGGDGGTVREVLRHLGIKSVTLVEVDGKVIEFCKEYLPSLSRGAFEDPRLRVVIQDGLEYVRSTDEKFDVIICDSTDPIGPGEALFTPEFYSGCKNALSEGGILVTQNGVPFLQQDEMIHSYQQFCRLFADATFYTASVPTYVGGDMFFGWGTDNKDLRKIDVEELRARLALAIDGEMRYYTPDIHKAAFALPKFIEDRLASAVSKPCS